MSHFTKSKLPVRMTDREALVKAAEKLGCTVLSGAKARGWNGNMLEGEIVLQHPKSPYDVALRKENEAYEPYADLWEGHVQRVYGNQDSPFGKLVARYGAEKAKRIAKAFGHTIYEKVDAKTGVITQRVVLSR